MIYRIKIKVVTKASRDQIIHEPDGSWKVRVTVAPTQGKANDRVIELMADEFKTAKSNIQIIHGLRNKEKIVEIIM
ncbi:MAG: DUF167 domain-containing protein [Patescibacteria group bacterium]